MGSPQGRERRLRRGSAARPDPAAPRTSDAIGSRVRRGRPISGAAAPQRPATLPAGPSPHGGSWLPSARGAPVADRGEERRPPAPRSAAEERLSHVFPAQPQPQPQPYLQEGAHPAAKSAVSASWRGQAATADAYRAAEQGLSAAGGGRGGV